jgi:probable phosphoglycerate mutase
MIIYLVRHGRTEWNDAGIIQGWTDSKLTPEGREQAERTAAFFAGMVRSGTPVAALYSSPLGRAWQTAQTIGTAIDMVPVALDDLREMHAGHAEGLTSDQWHDRWPDLLAASHNLTDLDFGWPGGETRRSFGERCLRVIAAIRDAHAPGDRVIAVTHGGIIRAYLTNAGLEDPAGPRAYSAANCSITQLEFPAGGEGGPSAGCVLAFSSTYHLAPDSAYAEINPDTEI